MAMLLTFGRSQKVLWLSQEITARIFVGPFKLASRWQCKVAAFCKQYMPDEISRSWTIDRLMHSDFTWLSAYQVHLPKWHVRHAIRRLKERLARGARQRITEVGTIMNHWFQRRTGSFREGSFKEKYVLYFFSIRVLRQFSAREEESGQGKTEHSQKMVWKPTILIKTTGVKTPQNWEGGVRSKGCYFLKNTHVLNKIIMDLKNLDIWVFP